MTFETKDSGKRADLAGGMVRDTEEGKIDYTLMLDGPMFERWAQLLMRGAKKYQPRNWVLATKSLDAVARLKTTLRFKASAFRHFMQWIKGDTDEDHAAAVFFNINGAEEMKRTEPAEPSGHTILIADNTERVADAPIREAFTPRHDGCRSNECAIRNRCTGHAWCPHKTIAESERPIPTEVHGTATLMTASERHEVLSDCGRAHRQHYQITGCRYLNCPVCRPTCAAGHTDADGCTHPKVRR